MAPIKKSKSVNKRFTNEASTRTDVGNSSKRKKKWTDKLGPQWTKGELERFYNAYRKHMGDWKKVAAAVRNNRSVDMVEALFYMNRAYLSLPEGTASVAGLIAMMTDHYSVIEGSESEGEGDDASGVQRKHLKRKRAKIRPSDSREEVIPPYSFASSEGCLSFLRQIPAYVKERRATGTRTPRVPVPITYERDDRKGYNPSNKRSKKQLDGDDEDNGHFVALTDASRREERSPYRKTELNESTPSRVGKMSLVKEAQTKYCDSSMFKTGVRIGRDRRDKRGFFDRDDALLMDVKRVGTVEVSRKGKNLRDKEAEGNDSDYSGEASSASEGLRQQKGMGDAEAFQGRYSLDGPDKKNKKLLYRDDFEALHALAELSALAPLARVMESESAAQLEEERVVNNVDEKSNTPETTFTEKVKQAGPKDIPLHAISAADKTKVKSAQSPVDGTSKRKRKPKVLGAEAPMDSIRNDKEFAEDDYMKTVIKTRRVGQGPAKQLKAAKISEEDSSTSDDTKTGQDAVVSATQISGLSPAALPQKPPNRRKMNLKKSLQERAKSSETTHDKPHNYKVLSEHDLLKEKVSTCLSYPLVRRRCIFEWFYSAIDYPWFAKMEFIDYLHHVGLGHVPRLTRLEWSVIKSSLGRPRRFSEKFLQEEQDKLKQYRESVRNHYAELRRGAREGLPTDLARPLSVGNRVIAIHPKTREIRDGKIMTVDHNKCNVMFDDLEVGLVMDIDCMPLHPLEYMPEGLRMQIDKCLSISKEAQLNRHSNLDASVMFPPVLENGRFPKNPSVKQDDMKGPVTTDQSYITTNCKARRPEVQRALMLQNTLDEKEMEPEILGIVSCSKSIAQAMVDAAIKAASLVKKKEDAGNMIQQALSSIGKHQPSDNSIVPGIKHQDHTDGSMDHHQIQSPSNTEELMINGVISQGGSANNEIKMPSELITSCVSTWLMIQMCTENQFPPADVAQLMDTAVSGLQPRCPQNMPIFREIQTCMGWIKTQIMALVRT